MAARWSVSVAFFLAIACLGPRGISAQEPTLPSTTPTVPGSTVSRMGPIPGSGGMVLGNAPGADTMILGGGRPGPSFPRVQPAPYAGQGALGGRPRGIAAPAKLLANTLPIYGPLSLPATAEDEGPPDGLTLDQALDRLVHDNLELRSKFYELPQAEADVLTASLRANPILFADTQLIPYGRYTHDRPGGPTQSDVNVSYPLDLSGKRHARTLVARRAANVIEAQYQNVVRLQIDNLYTAYVDVLAARETVRYARASVEGLDRVLRVAQTLFEKADATRADVARVKAQRARAEAGLDDARETLRRSKQVLASLLSIPADQAEALEIRGAIATADTTRPDLDVLLRLALDSRPDVVSQRLGVGRTQADVKLARAEAIHDVYLLYQPYTFQNNEPFGLKSPTSWALGATVPMPIFNRNQGAIARARLNVEQTQVELTALERQVVAEVIRAEQSYATSRAILERIERDILPVAKGMRDDALELFTTGEEDATLFFERQRAYNDEVRRYRDTLVRHRRDMLLLNTAVGRRVMP